MLLQNNNFNIKSNLLGISLKGTLWRIDHLHGPTCSIIKNKTLTSISGVINNTRGIPRTSNPLRGPYILPGNPGKLSQCSLQDIILREILSQETIPVIKSRMPPFPERTEDLLQLQLNSMVHWTILLYQKMYGRSYLKLYCFKQEIPIAILRIAEETANQFTNFIQGVGERKKRRTSFVGLQSVQRNGM